MSCLQELWSEDEDRAKYNYDSLAYEDLNCTEREPFPGPGYGPLEEDVGHASRIDEEHIVQRS